MSPISKSFASFAVATVLSALRLSAADAGQVEEAFAGKLAVIQAQSAKSDDVLSEQSLAKQTSAATQINKSVLVFPPPRRVRDRDHIRHVIKQPCLVCGRRPSDPHHLRFAQSRALSRKVSDCLLYTSDAADVYSV